MTLHGLTHTAFPAETCALRKFHNVNLITLSKTNTASQAFSQLVPFLKARIRHEGAFLLRGFDWRTPDDFQNCLRAFDLPLLGYDFGSTPRSELAQGIYTSTEYPAHQAIPLHNEQAYTTRWPDLIWFFCQTAAASGGATPLADSRRVYRELDAEVRETFERKGLIYVRNYDDGLDVPWQKVFATEEPKAVEAYCEAQGIEWTWTEGGLHTRQRCQVTTEHPVRGETVWFNQAHLFHVSALEPQLRELLVSIAGEENLPRNVIHADGSPIDEDHLNHIRAVYADVAVAFPWQNGDLLMLDNLLYAHGRQSFSGERRVLVAMAAV
ncbi:TauD/TfdA family dioxygenase [Acanthopleuribacter pedis]|uniref:TauD/TfdA family dioxygenase n=1 Tax=Acanthopleuribacter pedis TaxID=442870 RepID=A0A8J7QJM7_9BACT|nr:TauD/TfdA family dioxygenase [Acanthopleuribacter pedis]MBO1319420.1 TauD/TfdA family dioxygenase [Acanthopleuribacter pedis]